MSIYIDGCNKVKDIFINVNGKKKVDSCWVNKNGVAIKVFSHSTCEKYETAPTEAYSNWYYTLDDENNIITLNAYIGSETNVIVYANYEVNGKIYRTQLASSPNLGNGNLYMFNGQATGTMHRNITKSIKFSHSIDTSNITSMKYMFYDCEVLEEIDISGFDTSNVTNMSYLFVKCFNLTSIDLSNFDTSNVTDMSGMFSSCKALKTIYVTEGKWSTSQANIQSMFYNCGTSSIIYK